jgi:hypothetical protein
MLVGRSERKKPPGRLEHRWDCNFKIYFTEVGCEDVEEVYLAQDRAQRRDPVNTVMIHRVA